MRGCSSPPLSPPGKLTQAVVVCRDLTVMCGDEVGRIAARLAAQRLILNFAPFARVL